MDINIQKKNKIQNNALSEWLRAGKKGTCEIVTGLGKTFIFLHALYTMPKNDLKTQHLFLAEVTDRKKDLLEQIRKYNIIFKRNVLEDYNLKFACYQSAYKWKYRKLGLVGCDEVHDSLTPSYFKFYKNNSYDAIICLTATTNENKSYEIDGYYVTKGDMLEEIAPVCYKYSLTEALKDQTSRKLKVNVIFNELDPYIKYIKAGNIKKPFYQTEYSAYKYWDGRFKKAFFIEDSEKRDREFNISINKRTRILYNLKTKINNVKKLLLNLDTKSIVFGNSLEALNQVTPNVISSKKPDKINDIIKDNFNNNKINIIASFKKLKQGANLSELDNCIIMSYYSKDGDFIQRAGRLRDNGEIGNVFILVTKHTQEEIWFSKMIGNLKDLDIKYYKNIDECIENIKN